WTIRAAAAPLYQPKSLLICFPAVSNLAAVSTALNCVWLNVLYVSRRNCALRVSLFPSAIFLNSEIFHLFLPGPRIGSLGELPIPKLDVNGGLTASVLKACSLVRSPRDRFGLLTRITRLSTPLPVAPVISDVPARL